MTAFAIHTFGARRAAKRTDTAKRCEPLALMVGHRRGGGRGFGGFFGPGGGPGPGFGGPFFGPGRKASRGDIRAAILALLAEEPMHGYQIMRELGERSGGVWRPSPGSVYPTLQLLEDEGLVVPAETDGKRVFTLTDAGRAEAATHQRTPWDVVKGEADESLLALRDLVFQVMAATRQVSIAGTEAQIQAAQEVLRSARKSLYGILAADDPESATDTDA